VVDEGQEVVVATEEGIVLCGGAMVGIGRRSCLQVWGWCFGFKNLAGRCMVDCGVIETFRQVRFSWRFTNVLARLSRIIALVQIAHVSIGWCFLTCWKVVLVSPGLLPETMGGFAEWGVYCWVMFCMDWGVVPRCWGVLYCCCYFQEWPGIAAVVGVGCSWVCLLEVVFGCHQLAFLSLLSLALALALSWSL